MIENPTITFQDHDVHTLHRALAISYVTQHKKLKAAQSRVQERRGNSRPGAIASLALECVDIEALFKRVRDALGIHPEMKG